MIYGYARVSTKGQSLQPQRLALKAAGVQQVIEERISGTLTDRPKLNQLLAHLQPGDTLVVVRLDRLARSLPHLLHIVNDLANREINLHSLHEDIDTTTATGALMLNLFGALAQFERDLISERTKDGLKAAKKAGRRPGRPRKLTGDKLTAAHTLRAQGASYAHIARALDISKTTAYQALNPK